MERQALGGRRKPLTEGVERHEVDGHLHPSDDTQQVYAAVSFKADLCV